MNIDKELMDATILNEGFTLSSLWLLRDKLLIMSKELEILKELGITLRNVKETVDAETKLYYINTNLALIESVMEMKEFELFEISEYGDICLN